MVDIIDTIFSPTGMAAFAVFCMFLVAMYVAAQRYWSTVTTAKRQYEKAVLSLQELGDSTFDFIVVGGGTTGCLLATKLSASHSVLLVEAGGRMGRYSYARIPLSNAYCLGTELDYKDPVEFSVSSPSATGTPPSKMYSNARGCGLGGTSLLSWCQYTTGTAEEWDSIAADTQDASWSFEAVSPLLRQNAYLDVSASPAVVRVVPMALARRFVLACRNVLTCLLGAPPAPETTVSSPQGPQVRVAPALPPNPLAWAFVNTAAALHATVRHVFFPVDQETDQETPSPSPDGTNNSNSTPPPAGPTVSLTCAAVSRTGQRFVADDFLKHAHAATADTAKKTAKTAPGLVVLTGVRVHTLLCEGSKTVKGVSLETFVNVTNLHLPRVSASVLARRGVVLSAGAVGSPEVLLKTKELCGLSIPSSVGLGLRDVASLWLPYEVKRGVSFDRDVANTAPSFVNWITFGAGPLGSPRMEALLHSGAGPTHGSAAVEPKALASEAGHRAVLPPGVNISLDVAGGFDYGRLAGTKTPSGLVDRYTNACAFLITCSSAPLCGRVSISKTSDGSIVDYSPYVVYYAGGADNTSAVPLDRSVDVSEKESKGVVDPFCPAKNPFSAPDLCAAFTGAVEVISLICKEAPFRNLLTGRNGLTALWRVTKFPQIAQSRRRQAPPKAREEEEPPKDLPAPPEWIGDSAESLEFVKRISSLHARPAGFMVGTCKMGPATDSSAVVDPKSFGVHGVQGLYVADASVLPRVLNGGTLAACMVIANKAAESLAALK